MKTKLKLFAMMAFLVVTAVSCSKDDDSTPTPAQNTDNKYMGDWAGVFSGGDNGTWSMTVDKEGKFSGNLNSGNSGTAYPFDGSIDDNGEMKATIDVNGVIIDFNGTGSADGKTASGTWGNSVANISGVWSGAKL